MTVVIRHGRPVRDPEGVKDNTSAASTRPAGKLALPPHPERICWGCEQYCPAHDLACGNGTIRTLHPVELFGDDWLEWEAEKAEG